MCYNSRMTSTSAPAGTKEKVLIIEADNSYAESISSALAGQNYDPIVIKNGADGLKAVYDNLPHLILLDIVLPGADAYDILEKKHAEPLLKNIPVFLMSTQGVPINMRRVPQGSVAEFIISMHADPANIAERVNRQFGREAILPSMSAPANSNKKKILWVEDDKLIGTILAKKLISSGFDLFHAKNGEEALEALKSSIPDAIVLDLLLPGMTGFDILQRVKMDERLKKIPSMILSNLSKPSDIEKAKILGANKFLVKAAASLDQIVAEVNELAK